MTHAVMESFKSHCKSWFQQSQCLKSLSQQQLGLFICVGMFGRFPLQYWESIVYPVKNIKDVELPNVV